MTSLNNGYYLGIDGGGSGCRALLANAEGQIIGRGFAGPANIGADPVATRVNILSAAEEAIAQAGMTSAQLYKIHAVLGLAGANTAPDRDAFLRTLPFASTQLHSDTVTALQGGLGDGDGALVILGTGSAFIARRQGELTLIGGRGFMLNDHAGGARLGRDLLEQTLLALDGMADQSPLIHAVFDKFDQSIAAMIGFSRQATAAEYASFAPMLFEHVRDGDATATLILTQACHYIEKGLNAIGVETLCRYTMTGGLAASYATCPWLPFSQLYVPAQSDSLHGALALALKQAS